VNSQQLATFLFSALLASGSLLISAFGNLYTAYLRATAERVTAILPIIRRLCYLIALTVVLISATNLVVAHFLYAALDAIVPHIAIVLYVIVVFIAVPPAIISYRMFKDARPH
jgi:hypothetical protein